MTYKEKIVFGFVSESAKSVVKSFDVTSFPSLLKVSPTESTVLEGANTADGASLFHMTIDMLFLRSFFPPLSFSFNYLGLREALAKLAETVKVERAEETKKDTKKAPKKVEAEWLKVDMDKLDS